MNQNLVPNIQVKVGHMIIPQSVAHKLYLCNQPWTRNTHTINSHKFYEQKHEFSNAIYVIDFYQMQEFFLHLEHGNSVDPKERRLDCHNGNATKKQPFETSTKTPQKTPLENIK
jgi:hypothetical protein